MVREKCALGLDTSWRGENLLRRQRGKFVSYWIPAVWIFLGRVDDFEDAMVEGVGVQTGRFFDNGLADLVEIAIGVRFGVLWDRVRFFVGYGVVVSVDSRVNAFFSRVRDGTEKL
jgi:hypothetical protein